MYKVDGSGKRTGALGWRSKEIGGGDGGINREEEVEDRQRRGESVLSPVPMTDD